MNRLLNFRPWQRLLGVFLLLPLLMMGPGCSGRGADTAPAAEQSSTATASFSISIEESSAGPASRPGGVSAFSVGRKSASGVSALAFSVADIVRVRIDVKEKDTGTLIYDNFDLLKEGNTWSGKLPFLPKGKAITFVARALDTAGTALFSGTTDQTLSTDNETVIIRMEAFNDGQVITLPRITRITIPNSFPQGKRGNISFSVSATTGEKLSYVITGATGGGTFLPQTGTISLQATAATFVSQYAPPSVSAETEFTHEVLVTNAAGHSVRTTFKTKVVPVVQDDVLNPTLVVQFNPVINAISASRPVGTSDVMWKATVVDDGPLTELQYKWTFTPNGTFTPAPDFADLGTTNPAKMVNYTPALQGELKLSVTDAQGGETVLTYALTPDQFPTDLYDVGDLKGLQAISSGAGHTCVLMDNEFVRCWGYGFYGQLGYNSSQNVGDSPSRLPYMAGSVNLVGKAIQVVTGGSHTCALLDSGFVRCWGRNQYGQLGYGNTDTIGDNTKPVTSQGYVSLGGRATRLTAGMYHTCALLTTGRVRCWGYNNHGQLGYGNYTNVGDSQPVWKAGDVDLTLSTGVTVKDVAAGNYHTCVLLSSGGVRCWGYNVHGELGNNSTTEIKVPPTADIAVGGPVKQLSGGGMHTCALLETGKVRCWGNGYYGQLGYPTYSGYNYLGDNEIPALAGDVNVGEAVLQVVASKNTDDLGRDHTCALLISGGVKCWGYNEYSELGLGNTDNLNSPNPTPINLGGTSAYAVSVGGRYTCALLSTGKPRCWGYNYEGELGYGHTINTPLAQPTTGEVKVSGP